MAQIEFQRIIIHLHEKRRRKQSNYIKEPARVYKITRRLHADGAEKEKKTHGRFEHLRALLLLESLPKTLQRRVELSVWRLGGGVEVGEMTKGKKWGNFHFHCSTFDEKPLQSPWGSHCDGGPMSTFPHGFPTHPHRVNSPSTKKTQGSKSRPNLRGGQGQQHLEDVNLLT